MQGGDRKAQNTMKPNITVRNPNILVIQNFMPDLSFYQGYEMVFMVTHPKTLSTIHIGIEYWFEALCRKNIEIILYNNDLRFLNIDIGSVSVDLSLDNFQNAESEKASLLQEMIERSAIDNIFIAY